MKGLLEKIKSSGYWHVVVRPADFLPQRIGSLAKAEEIVQACTVRFRGWPYPFFPQDRRGITRETEFVQGYCEFDDILEVWRYYQSGQFVHFFAMREDRTDRSTLTKSGWDVPSDPRIPLLSVMSVLFSFVEVFEFAARLAERKALGDQISVEVSLHKTKGRRLVFLDLKHLPLFPPRMADADQIRLARLIPVPELLANAPAIALEETVKSLEYFHWDDPPIDVLRADQESFRSRRY